MDCFVASLLAMTLREMRSCRNRSPDAAQRVSGALLIRGPSFNDGWVPALRRHSVSKTRVNALMHAAPRPGHETNAYAFTDGRSATRAIHATMLPLAASSGWPTVAAKSSQP